MLFWHGVQACQKLDEKRCAFFFSASAADFAEAEGTECCLLIEASIKQPWKSQQSGQAGPFFRTRRLLLGRQRIVHHQFQNLQATDGARLLFVHVQQSWTFHGS